MLARALEGTKEGDERLAWQNDTFPELHAEDMLWAHTSRVSSELDGLRGRMRDNVLFHLMKAGTFDWTAPEDKRPAQATLAMRHSTAMVSRLVSWLRDEERKVCIQ